MNRGSDFAFAKRIFAHEASMRPRFMNRGSPSGCGPAKPTDPRFNEAPIHESGK